MSKFEGMDKGRRNELRKLKFKKRLSQLGLVESEGNFNCFRTTGKPCSCAMCSPKEEKAKYKIKYKHQLKKSDPV